MRIGAAPRLFVHPSTPRKLGQASLSQQWWNWAASFPPGASPLNGTPGAAWSLGDQGSVFFLARAGTTDLYDLILPSDDNHFGAHDDRTDPFAGSSFPQDIACRITAVPALAQPGRCGIGPTTAGITASRQR
jgi:hypothetical protein